MNQTTLQTKQNPNAASSKKPYERPRLTVFGSLTELTQGSGTGKAESGSSGHKT